MNILQIRLKYQQLAFDWKAKKECQLTKQKRLQLKIKLSVNKIF